jgi:uncharacterized protein
VKPQASDPRRLDVAALCRGSESVEGRAPLAGLPRLCDMLVLPQGDAPDVAWSAQGSLRARPGAAAERWLRVRAEARVVLQCQRCLEPLPQGLQADRSILFVDSEKEAERLDQEIEDDVLALPPRFDLLEWIEDELMLALPLVPRHDACAALPAGAEAPERARPFEALAALHRGDR